VARVQSIRPNGGHPIEANVGACDLNKLVPLVSKAGSSCRHWRGSIPIDHVSIGHHQPRRPVP